jgi:2-keto-4-pentenoate hydratase/2-oxohepta-3-ene-1,7-dioic acid hydratase in catechol pathway
LEGYSLRLIAFAGHDGRNALGLMLGDARAVDLSKAAARDGGPEAWGRDMIELISGGNEAVDWLRSVAAGAAGVPAVALADVRVLAPIPRPRKNIFCVGLNYRDHVTEHDSGRPLPQIPVFFTKPPTTVIGPEAEIPWHPVTTQLDYEIELAVIIGPGGKDIKAADAWDHVWGYTILNDVSARDLQRGHGGQWFKGKALDGACPMGPWIVHKSAVPEPQNLNFVSKVSGEVRQQSNTGRMIFDVPALIESLSAGLTLEPGDILATGTCSGVGSGFSPPRFLKDGDLVEMTIEGIGTLRNRVRRA